MLRGSGSTFTDQTVGYVAVRYRVDNGVFSSQVWIAGVVVHSVGVAETLMMISLQIPELTENL